jgi:hypothetical protein
LKQYLRQGAFYLGGSIAHNRELRVNESSFICRYSNGVMVQGDSAAFDVDLVKMAGFENRPVESKQCFLLIEIDQSFRILQCQMGHVLQFCCGGTPESDL